MGFCSIEGVYKAFEHKRVLDNLNLKIEEGKFTCLVGPSGCGKTTLINLIAGHDFPDRGKIFFRGEPVKGPDADRLIVFQETALFEWLNLWENTIWGPLSRTKGKMPEESLDKTARWIERVGLKGFEDKYPLQLSGGMQRRAELIRGLVNEPSLLLMDEPFRGLDAMTRELMLEYVTELFEELERRITFLLITSDIQEAIFMSDIVYFMSCPPATITKSMLVDLPRPRKLDLMTTQEFFKYKREAIDVVYSEENVEKGGWDIVKRLRECLGPA
jgi:NitT/TauT family transport system ATP-binding protein